MDWQTLKEKIYYEDGSLRDIHVKGSDEKDWALWADFVNSNYRIQIDDHKTVVENGRIDIDKVLKLWEDPELERFFATIFVGNALVNVYFFEGQIENDICPKEIVSVDDHNLIVAYMMGISKFLNKEVILTPENTEDEPLISVNQDSVAIF